MDAVLRWSLWAAGIAALLGGFGIARVMFEVLFIRVDALMILVGLICLFNAWWRFEMRPLRGDTATAPPEETPR